MRYSILTLLFGLLLLGCQPTEQSPKQSPNIIYILADDLGYGELGAYGQEKINLKMKMRGVKCPYQRPHLP